MRLLSLALLLLAVGCSQSFPDQDTAETRELRAFGAETWLKHGIRAPSDYTLALVEPEELADLCEADHVVGGCTYPEAGAILLDGSLDQEQLRVGIVHELGHLVAKQRGHLDCGEKGKGPDAMCPHADSALPTPRDIRFVLAR